MKTIGVLGGLGPQATMDFERRVHAVAQRLIAPRFNAGYPPMLVHYCRHAPMLVNDDGSPRLPLTPDPRLLEAAQRLGQVADFLVIPSNGAHVFQREVETAANRPLLSMIGATLAHVAQLGWTRVGVLGLGEPIVYTRPLAERGIAFETIDGDTRAALDAAIFRTMEGRDSAADVAAARRAVADLRARSVDGVILGCTEIPLLLGDAPTDADLVNPTRLLAESAVQAAMG